MLCKVIYKLRSMLGEERCIDVYPVTLKREYRLCHLVSNVGTILQVTISSSEVDFVN